MYTSVRRYRVRGALAAFGRRVEQGLVPLVARAAGFRSFAVLDVGEGLAVTITVFADRAAAEDAERQSAAWFAEHLAAVVTREDGTAGEVLVHAGL